VLGALVTLAQAEEESSKTAFYVAGAVLAAFAVVISAIGIRGHETFPPSRGAARAVMGLAIVLVAATMAAAILTS
jgi:peptidoglycan/LPS O-acetylase OafA/YrhL